MKIIKEKQDNKIMMERFYKQLNDEEESDTDETDDETDTEEESEEEKAQLIKINNFVCLFLKK